MILDLFPWKIQQMKILLVLLHLSLCLSDKLSSFVFVETNNVLNSVNTDSQSNTVSLTSDFLARVRGNSKSIYYFIFEDKTNKGVWIVWLSIPQPSLIAITFDQITRIALVVILLLFVILFGIFARQGIVKIGEDEVGIVFKKFSLNPLQSRPKLIALHGEAGWQANILTPGWHWWHWPFMYSVTTVS
jgi:hypothetical protein